MERPRPNGVPVDGYRDQDQDQDQDQDDDGHEASDGRGRAGETARADVIADAVGSSRGDAIEVAAMGARVVVFGMDQDGVIPVRQAVITERAL